MENFERDFEIFDKEKSRAEETATSEKKKAGRGETEAAMPGNGRKLVPGIENRGGEKSKTDGKFPKSESGENLAPRNENSGEEKVKTDGNFPKSESGENLVPGIASRGEGKAKTDRKIRAGKKAKPAKARKKAEPGEPGDKTETETVTRGKEKARLKRKKRKSLKRIFEYLLSLEVGEEGALPAETEGILVSRGMTVNEAIAAVQVAKAMKGDAKAFELIRNTLGEKGERPDEIPPVLIIRRDGSRQVI